MLRGDGSVKSANLPTWDNRYQVRDFGLYRGVVNGTVYPEDDNNDSGRGSPNEVLYNVMIVGGDRDGQIFPNARVLRGLGGFTNFEEVTLKHLEGVTKADPASIIALGDFPISSIPEFNGDVIYIQFLNGDTNMPVIVGMGYHQKAEAEASAEEAPRYRRKFNGIYTEITRDGEYTWSKDNGAFVPVLPNPDDPKYPFVSQFAPLPGQEDAVTVTLDNEYNLRLEYKLGLFVSIKGTDDVFELATTSGSSVKLSGGTEDSFQATTVTGTGVVVSGGTADSINLTTAAGAEISVNGASDSLTLANKAGNSVEIKAAGIQASTADGNSLSMTSGAIELGSGGQAKLVLDKTGFIQLGNSGGDVLKDVLQELLKALLTEMPAGYGAPLVNASTYAQLLAKCQLITGG